MGEGHKRGERVMTRKNRAQEVVIRGREWPRVRSKWQQGSSKSIAKWGFNMLVKIEMKKEGGWGWRGLWKQELQSNQVHVFRVVKARK